MQQRPVSIKIINKIIKPLQDKENEGRKQNRKYHSLKLRE